MKTNKYIERYMRLNNDISEGEDGLSDMCWEDSLFGLTVIPEHFNYFSFKVLTKDAGSTLTIDKARELAKWLLKVTDGLGDTHEIIDEMIKRGK